MPWKIKSLVSTGEAPVLHLADTQVNVHLLTHLDSGVVDLYIGHATPAASALWFSIDTERKPVLNCERVGPQVSKLQLRVMASILESMQFDSMAALRPVYKELGDRKRLRGKRGPVFARNEIPEFDPE